MTLVREPGSEILAQFGVPIRGTWVNTAINTVPTDAVYDSLNVFVREGKLRNRPGLLPNTSKLPFTIGYDMHIIGGGASITPNTKRVFAVSTNRLFAYDDVVDSWISVGHPVGIPHATATTDVIDTAFMEYSPDVPPYVLLIAHPSHTLMRWRGDTGIGDIATSVVTGTNIPSPSSICISASRVIALIPPNTIVWSRILNYTNFDALAIVKRAQTTDRGICVRSLSALSFALYKETSIHTARAQAGLDEGSAFAFSEPIIVEGPAGIYAVVDVNGIHMYMTKSGRIALFDGTNYPQWIADGIWFYLQADINQSTATYIKGVYDYRLNIVVFFYPRVGETDSMTGIVIVNLPFPGFEPQEGLKPYCFLGICAKDVTHAVLGRLDDDISRAIVFTVFESELISHNHNLSETAINDGDDPYTCSFQTGLQSAPDARHIQTTSETFVERGVGYGNLVIAPVTSDTLDTPGGTVHTADAQNINLGASPAPVNEYIGFNKKTRFFGFKYTWSSMSTVRYAGTVVYDSVFRRK